MLKPTQDNGVKFKGFTGMMEGISGLEEQRGKWVSYDPDCPVGDLVPVLKKTTITVKKNTLLTLGSLW